MQMCACFKEPMGEVIDCDCVLRSDKTRSVLSVFIDLRSAACVCVHTMGIVSVHKHII